MIETWTIAEQLAKYLDYGATFILSLVVIHLFRKLEHLHQARLRDLRAYTKAIAKQNETLQKNLWQQRLLEAKEQKR